MSKLRWASVVLLGSLGACGYGFPGHPSHIPKDSMTISVRPFRNLTRQVGINFVLVSAIEDVIRERGTFKVVPGKQAELLLTGNVRSFTSRPVGFSEIDRAQQYETTMVLDVDLRRRSDGGILWSGRGLVEKLDAAITPNIVIPTSPRFQQGTLNARNLEGLTEIQLAEDQRSQEVLRGIVDTMAGSIYSQMMEGF